MTDPSAVEAVARAIISEATYDYGETWVNIDNADECARAAIAALRGMGWVEPDAARMLSEAARGVCIHHGRTSYRLAYLDDILAAYDADNIPAAPKGNA